MPLSFGPEIVEGKVYRSKKKDDNEEEKRALKELQTILSYKNRNPCGCEAQSHDLVENCLNCGRLTCSLEGPGKCFSCGGIVLTEDQRNRLQKHIDILHCSPSMSASANNQSQLPKTKIIDNQFDRFAIDNKKHLREEDRRKLREDLDDLQSKRYQRKYVLDVDIDNLEAGLRSMPCLDYEDELKKFQTTHQLTHSSAYTLAELVAKESKINYSFSYVPPSKRKQPSISDTSSSANAPVNNTQLTTLRMPQALPMNVPISTNRVLKRKSQARASAWDRRNNGNNNIKASSGISNKGSKNRGAKRS